MFPHFDQSEYAVALKNAYRQFPAKDSTLDIDFINNRNRVAGVYGAALNGATFTRSTTGTYFGSDGLLKTAAINEPRFEYDPVSLRPLGLLIEESRANILLNSDTGATQSVTVSATAYTLSFWGTGTVTLSGVSTAGPLVGTGANTRVTLTFTPTAGTLTLTVSGTVTKWQLEAGAFPTSYIPTTDASVTRGTDVASMTGANFSSWYNQSEGSFSVSVSVNHLDRDARLITLDSGSTTNMADVTISSANNSIALETINSGIYSGAVNSGVIALRNTPIPVAIGYAASPQSIAAFGGATVTGALQFPTGVITRLLFGFQGVPGAVLNGYIQRLSYYPKRLPNNLLQYLSRPTA